MSVETYNEIREIAEESVETEDTLPIKEEAEPPGTTTSLPVCDEQH